MAQRDQMAFGDLLPETRGGRALRVDAVRREGEERRAPVGVEGGLQSGERGRKGIAVAVRPPQAPGRRQSEAHAEPVRARGRLSVAIAIDRLVCP